MATNMLLTSAPTIGGRLGQARRFAGMTQTELAQAVGVSLRTYQNWERDKHEVTVTGLKRIAKATNFPPLWLLNGEDDEDEDAVIARYAADAQPTLFDRAA